MELYEYQVKSLLPRAGILCSDHVVIDRPSDLSALLSRLKEGEKIIRPQLHGGCPEERVEAPAVEGRLTALLGSRGMKILVMAPVEAEKWYQLSVTTLRSGTIELTASQKGKRAAVEHLFEGAFRSFQINRLVGVVGLKERQANLFKKIVEGALRTFYRYDASSLHLDTIALTEEGLFEVVDASMECDDRALFRQPELCQIVGRTEPSFPRLLIDEGGPIACVGNGEGLVLAAADFVSIKGGSLGAVIDVGSEGVTDYVVHGLKMAEKAKAVLLVLFTGLIDGEVIATRLRKERMHVPVVAFFEGTNTSGARRVLSESRSMLAAESLPEAVAAVVRKGGE